MLCLLRSVYHAQRGFVNTILTICVFAFIQIKHLWSELNLVETHLLSFECV